MALTGFVISLTIIILLFVELVRKGIKKGYFTINKRKLIISSVSTTAFMMAAHMYVWTNGFFMCDNATIYRGLPRITDTIGDKWFSYLIGYIDYGYDLPWFAGIMSTFFMIIAVYALVETMEIDTPVGIILCAGICSTNSSIISINQYTGGQHLQISALAEACVALYIIRKTSLSISIKLIISTVLIAISVGTYGSYIGIIPAILIWVIIEDIFRGEKAKKILCKCGIYVVCFASGIILYYIILRSLLFFYGARMSSYMGENNLETVSGTVSIFSHIPNAYKQLMIFYFNGSGLLPEMMCVIIRIVFVFGLALAAPVVIKKFRDISDKAINIPLIILSVLIMPIAINLIYITASGTVHHLMTFVYCAPLLILIRIFEIAHGSGIYKGTFSYIIKLIPLLLGVFIYYSCVAANAAHVHMGIMYDESWFICGRIIDRIENLDDFRGDETVILYGDLQFNDHYKQNDAVKTDFLNARMGIHNNGNVNTVNRAYMIARFAKNIMNSSLDMRAAESMQEVVCENTDLLESMTVFPQKESVKKEGNYIFVKLSDGSQSF